MLQRHVTAWSRAMTAARQIDRQVCEPYKVTEEDMRSVQGSDGPEPLPSDMPSAQRPDEEKQRTRAEQA